MNNVYRTDVSSQSEIYRRGNVENDWNSSVVRRSPSKAIIGFPIIFLLFPMPEVPLSGCWPSLEMPGILCFKIVGIPTEACAAQLSRAQIDMQKSSLHDTVSDLLITYKIFSFNIVSKLAYNLLLK